jgi:enterochelin esterase family protein
VLAAIVPAYAQQNERIVSPEIGSDGRVTLRFRDPNANVVVVNMEGMKRPLSMHKGDDGVWSVTTDPLEPDFYGYSIVADGVRLIDPENPFIRPNLLGSDSMVHVPGPASLPWEVNNVSHGVIHHHFYHSIVVGDDRDFYVYTPPNYEARAQKTYPVLYLLHGYSDDASAWTTIARANVILDNLIAQGKAKPMLIVMPLGYGAPELLTGGWSAVRDQSLLQRNYGKFRDALLQEVIPAVESAYRVSKDRDSRAIAGLSMGGSESLFVGLNTLDRFGWIGAFSSGGLNPDYEKTYPGLDAKANSQLRLLWISCGKDDRLYDPDAKLRDWLQSKGIRVMWTETPGAHWWPVWRRNLTNFVPLLFRGK